MPLQAYVVRFGAQRPGLRSNVAGRTGAKLKANWGLLCSRVQMGKNQRLLDLREGTNRTLVVADPRRPTTQ